MKKSVLIVSALTVSLVLLGAGCGSSTVETNSNTTVSKNTNTVVNVTPTNTTTTTTTTTNTTSTTTNAVNSPASADTSAATTKTFDVTASQFEFDPSTITVNQGDTVVLNITSEDVPHGFSLPDFDVSETLTPGKTKQVTFVADKAGSFTFSCSVVCGSGHSSMKGTLVVQ